MKLWEKGIEIHEQVERFTIGNDREHDSRLLKADILGTIAHTKMLSEQGLMTESEFNCVKEELLAILEQGTSFTIEEEYEDIHSKLESMLIAKLGDTGKKVHTARSRNDQVLTALRIYFRDEIEEIKSQTETLFQTLIIKSEKHKDDLLPGYTHMQVAMPSSFGLWFSAYAESLAEDLLMLQAAYRLSNTNPLGSAAGYGSSFPVNRSRTTELLGFESLSVNVITAQMGRGKTERFLATAISAIAATLSKLSMDCCLYLSQNYRFITLPDAFTTGSSIMPHKKNPDVFELIRARCNRLQSLPNEVAFVTSNLTSGYHRDFQELKDVIFPAITTIKECLEMTINAVEAITPVKDLLKDPKYTHVFTVEDVNKLTLEGVPFRDAYRKIADEVNKGNYHFDGMLNHTHEGSIGNLCLDLITRKMNDVLQGFGYEKVTKAMAALLKAEETELTISRQQQT